MKTVFLLSALACAALAAPGHNNNNRQFTEGAEGSEIREKKSPTLKSHVPLLVPVVPVQAPIHVPYHQPLLHHGIGHKPHIGLFRETNGNEEEDIIHSKESINQQNVQGSIQMAKAAFDNLENDLNNIEEREKSADIEKARQALEDARQSFAELESMRIASDIVDDAVKVPTTELKQSEAKRMSQWKSHKETIQKSAEDSTPLKGHKAIEMEESASNNKELFRAPEELDNLPNHHLQKNSEQVQMNKEVTSSIEVAKNAEDEEKGQQTKPLETDNMKAKNTFNRNSMSLSNEMPEKKNAVNINMEKKMNLDNHPRASTPFLEVPKQPQHKDAKPQLSLESSPVMPVDTNTNQKNRQSLVKSAEHIDSKWSSTQNNEQVVQGKSAELENIDNAPHGNQFVATHERANQADLPWRPPGSKVDLRNQEGEFMRENMQWKHSPQTDMRSAYGASYGLGGSSSAGIISGVSGAGSGGAGAIGIFPNAQLSNCAIPLLLSCSPSVTSGSLGKSYSSSSYGSSSYGSSAGVLGSSGGAYRSADHVNHPAKRDAKKLNRIDLTKTKRSPSKDYPQQNQQYRIIPKKY